MSIQPVARDPVEADLPNPAPSPMGHRVAHRFALTAAIAVLALTPRLVYLFAAGDPQNAGDGMTDTYHHWQIGYLTQQVGLSHDLRLWDLKGLEYFWGVLHPIMLVILFWLTRSVDLIIPRLLSIAAGTLSVILIFHLCRRYWGNQVAWAATAFAALAPPVVFTETLGMVEPLAVALVLLGIWWSPSRGFLAGVTWALAAMARAEAWLATFGLLVASVLPRVRSVRRVPLVIGWMLAIGAYMNLLLIRTGNPIYPVYWEFLVEGTGRWLAPATSSQLQYKLVFTMLLLATGAGLLWTLWRRPTGYLLLCYGFGSTAFVLGLLALTPFISSWSGWVWRMRLFVFSLEFGALLAAIALFVLLPRSAGNRFRGGAWVVTAVALVAVQLTWIPIQSAYNETEPAWRETLTSGRYLAGLYNQQAHHWGTLNIPADQPDLTYSLVRFGGVRGGDLIGQLYDPFYDRPPSYRYADHRAAASQALACWLKSTNTSVFVVPTTNQNYVGFLTDNSGDFTEIGRVTERGWLVESINSTAIAATCSQSGVRQ